MKHLLFVSVALGIFSGTTIQAPAQTSVNFTRVNDAGIAKKSEKFIESIEIRPGAMGPEQPVIKKPVETTRFVPEVTAKNTAAAIENCTALQFKYAQLLNMEVESISNNALYGFIEKWWATPYQYGGANSDGVDCSAYSGTLIHEVYGITLSRTARSQYQECKKIKKDHLREGDLVFFKIRHAISHVGVYLGNGFFTHASTSNGVIISSLDDPYYSKKFVGGGRIAANNATEE
jgi:hypothetical protein